MRIIGENEKDAAVIVVMTTYEWEIIQIAGEVPSEKRSKKVNAQVDVEPIDRNRRALCEAKIMRKELGGIQKKWDALAARLDTVMDK